MQLSFLIISYNEREYLPQAIESCLNQGVEDSEIIIADDGSNDGSVEIIREYAERYPDKIRYLVHDRSDVVPGKVLASIRVSNGIKRALEIARGRYCRVVAGDDYLLPGTFSADAVAFLDAHPRYSAYVGGYQKVWEDRPPVVRQPFAPAWLYWSGDYLHVSAFVFRRSMYEKGGFLLRFCDDTGLHYSLAVDGKWHYTADVTMAYRQRSGSIMHESDAMELDLMELMLMQDTLQVGKLYWQSLARFCKPLWRVFQNRSRLSDPKYSKYVENCAQYPHDILAEYAGYDQMPRQKQIKILLRLVLAKVLRWAVLLVLPFRRAWRKLGRKVFGPQFI